MKLSWYGAVLAVLGQVDAWILDSSCVTSKYNYQTLLVNGMTDAFDLARAALAAINALQAGTANEAQRDLMHPVTQRVIQVFQGVLAFDKNGNGQPSTLAAGSRPPSDDVVVYCDYSRFIEGQTCSGVKDPTVACDRSIQKNIEMDDAYKSCKSNLSPEGIMAFTAEQLRNTASQIQMCRWYLQMSNGYKFKYWPEGHPRPTSDEAADLFGKQRTAMDAAALFDHTLLNEMTHAVNDAIATVDVDANGDSYGWNNCVGFSLRPPHPWEVSYRNADNYAFFGLGARMISPANGAQPQRPNQDGSISVLPPSKRKRGHSPAPPEEGEKKPSPASKEKSTAKTTDTKTCTSTKTASSCAITVSVFTPSGLSTASTSTITGTCSTTKGCSVTNTVFTTTTTSGGDTIITPFYDPDNWDGNNNWLATQQTCLEALMTDTEPMLTWTSSSQPAAQRPRVTPRPQSRPPRPARPRRLCGAPTTIAPPGVPQDHVQNNITDFCAMVSSDALFDNHIYQLPTDFGTRSIDLEHLFPNVMMYLNISLVTGKFGMNESACNEYLNTVLNGCPPFEKAPGAAHLFKFGGGIPVEGPEGVASFNMTLVPKPGAPGNEPNCAAPDC
ncbi:hypothetical protein VTN77DRAFT_8794 [Rasamsonia byssochlamydoides]|uniref:uncharacterized protein n=1 Tax=Rasamsonia byssochlamydoides TaxID=89139 RepID=UPI003742873B